MQIRAITSLQIAPTVVTEQVASDGAEFTDVINTLGPRSDLQTVVPLHGPAPTDLAEVRHADQQSFSAPGHPVEEFSLFENAEPLHQTDPATTAITGWIGPQIARNVWPLLSFQDEAVDGAAAARARDAAVATSVVLEPSERVDQDYNIQPMPPKDRSTVESRSLVAQVGVPHPGDAVPALHSDPVDGPPNDQTSTGQTADENRVWQKAQEHHIAPTQVAALMPQDDQANPSMTRPALDHTPQSRASTDRPSPMMLERPSEHHNPASKPEAAVPGQVSKSHAEAPEKSAPTRAQVPPSGLKSEMIDALPKHMPPETRDFSALAQTGEGQILSPASETSGEGRKPDLPALPHPRTANQNHETRRDPEPDSVAKAAAVRPEMQESGRRDQIANPADPALQRSLGQRPLAADTPSPNVPMAFPPVAPVPATQVAHAEKSIAKTQTPATVVTVLPILNVPNPERFPTADSGDFPATDFTLSKLGFTAALPTTPVAQPSAPIPIQAVQQTLGYLIAKGETGPIELTLRPEELGKIRFEMTATGEKVHMILFVERPDALELMRRHGDQLLADLRQSGFSQASLSFSDWDNRGQHKAALLPMTERPNQSLSSDDVTAIEARTLQSASHGRLDLRL